MSKRKKLRSAGPPEIPWKWPAIWVVVMVFPFVVLYWTVPFVGDTSINMDYVMFPTPHQQELMYSVEHGTWPLYVPGFAGGRPAAALTLGQLFHPISHLASHLPGYWNGHALELNTLLRLLSLGLTQMALLLLLRRWGLTLEVAFLVSLVTVYNMRMLDVFRFGAGLENYTGHLLLCCAIGLSYLRPTRLLAPAALMGSTYLLVVGGHPQMFYLALLASALFAVLTPFVTAAVRGEQRPSPGLLLRFYGRTATWCLAGVLLASAYTVPLYFDFVVETPGRAGMDYEWSLLNTDSWGGELNSFFRPLNVSVEGAFGGCSIILLALLAPLAVARGRIPWSIIATWGFVLLVIAIALGDATPLHYLFWNYLPFAGAFRVPGRVVIILPCLLLLLLGWIFSDPQRKEALRRRLGLLALSGAALFGLYQLWLSRYVPPPRYPVAAEFREVPQDYTTLVAGVGIAILALAALYARFPRMRIQLGILLVLLGVTQTSMVLRFGTWMAPTPTTTTLTQMDAQKAELLSFRGNPGNLTQSALVDRRMTGSFIDGWLAKFYRRYEVVHSEEEAFAALASTREADEIVVENFESAGVEPVGPAGAGTDRVVLEEGNFNRLLFSVENASAGFLNLTLLDRYRFKALVNGKEVHSYRANGGERAVYLPAGRHRVEFRYWSRAAFAGVVVSLLTLCVFGVYAALQVPRRRGRARVAALVAALVVPGGLFGCWHYRLYHGEDLGTRYTWDSRQLPDARNLAYGRKTEMSSILNKYIPYHYYAGRGVDGDRQRTGFATAGEANPWWQVDLGERRPIGEIAVHSGPRTVRQGGRRVLAMVSEDGSRFEEVGWIAAGVGAGPSSLALGGRSARFIRLQLPGRGRLTLNEVEVYAPDRLESEGRHDESVR